MTSTDQHYYPATDKLEWEPLHKALCAGWMFMQADTEGRFYYKHQMTRAYLVVSASGEIVQDGRTGAED